MKKEISITSKIENISLVENIIDEVSTELSIVADIYGNILIAIIEAVTNSIVHGNKGIESKIVKIIISHENSVLSVYIKDEGTGFDFHHIPDPTKPGNVEKPDGRGVFLMEHLADDISFEDNGAIVNLKFNL